MKPYALDIKSAANEPIRPSSAPHASVEINIQIPPYYKTRFGIELDQSATTAPIPIETNLKLLSNNPNNIRFIPPELLLTARFDNKTVILFQALSLSYINGRRHLISEQECKKHLQSLSLKNLRGKRDSTRKIIISSTTSVISKPNTNIYCTWHVGNDKS